MNNLFEFLNVQTYIKKKCTVLLYTMNRSQLENLTKNQLIDLLLVQNTQENNIIEPPVQFQDIEEQPIRPPRPKREKAKRVKELVQLFETLSKNNLLKILKNNHLNHL